MKCNQVSDTYQFVNCRGTCMKTDALGFTYSGFQMISVGLHLPTTCTILFEEH